MARDYPDAVVLVRVGDFYEAHGLSAVMLVEHGRLNPMGSHTEGCRAGAPWRNVQVLLCTACSVSLGPRSRAHPAARCVRELGWWVAGDRLPLRVLTTPLGVGRRGAACGASQKLLDQLTRAQLTVVVCEQREAAPGATRVERYVSEVISPHNPKYTFEWELRGTDSSRSTL